MAMVGNWVTARRRRKQQGALTELLEWLLTEIDLSDIVLPSMHHIIKSVDMWFCPVMKLLPRCFVGGSQSQGYCWGWGHEAAVCYDATLNLCLTTESRRQRQLPVCCSFSDGTNDEVLQWHITHLDESTPSFSGLGSGPRSVPVDCLGTCSCKQQVSTTEECCWQPVSTNSGAALVKQDESLSHVKVWICLLKQCILLCSFEFNCELYYSAITVWLTIKSIIIWFS